MMRYALVPLVIAVTTAMLFSSITPARVCSCVLRDEPTPMEMRVAAADAIVVGTVTDLREQGFIVSVDRYLKGEGPTPILMRSPQPNLPPGSGPYLINSCDGLNHTALNRVYLLFLYAGEAGSGLDGNYWEGGMCSLGGSAQLGDPVGDSSDPRVSAVEAVTGAGQSPSVERDVAVIDAQLATEPSLDEALLARSRAIAIDNLPANGEWAVAFALPLAFIAGAAIRAQVKRRHRTWL